MKVAGSREQRRAEGGEQEGFFKKIPPLNPEGIDEVNGVGGCFLEEGAGMGKVISNQ